MLTLINKNGTIGTAQTFNIPVKRDNFLNFKGQKRKDAEAVSVVAENGKLRLANDRHITITLAE